jgi:hypothetical protein
LVFSSFGANDNAILSEKSCDEKEKEAIPLGFTPDKTAPDHQAIRNGLFILHSLSELIHASAGIDELLLAGVERMALRANVNTVFLARGCRFKLFAASATNRDLVALGVDSLFHAFTSHQKSGA